MLAELVVETQLIQSLGQPSRQGKLDSVVVA